MLDPNKLRALKAAAYQRGDKKQWKLIHDALYQPKTLKPEETAEVERLVEREPDVTPLKAAATKSESEPAIKSPGSRTHHHTEKK